MSPAGPWNYNDIRQTNGEKHPSYIKFSQLRGGLHKRMRTQRSDQNRKFSDLLDKEIIHLGRKGKMKGSGIGTVHCAEVTKRYSGEGS